MNADCRGSGISVLTDCLNAARVSAAADNPPIKKDQGRKCLPGPIKGGRTPCPSGLRWAQYISRCPARQYLSRFLSRFPLVGARPHSRWPVIRRPRLPAVTPLLSPDGAKEPRSIPVAPSSGRGWSAFLNFFHPIEGFRRVARLRRRSFLPQSPLLDLLLLLPLPFHLFTPLLSPVVRSSGHTFDSFPNGPRSDPFGSFRPIRVSAISDTIV